MPEQLVTPRLLSQKGAANYSGVSLRTVEHWVASNTVASVKIGKRRLIEKESLDAFIDQAARIPAKTEPELTDKSPVSLAEQIACEVVRLMRES